MIKILLLCLSAILFSGCQQKYEAGGSKGEFSTVKNPMGFYGRYPGQFSLDEYQILTNKKLSFKENPVFADKVSRNELPCLSMRLPEEPLIMQPYHEIGTYGGEITGSPFSLPSGCAEVISWRQSNLFNLADDLRSVVPAVAKGWEWNNDFTQLTVYLRKGHKWSDGAPFTADDVIFWWEDIMMNEEINSSFRYQWTRFENPEKLKHLDKVPNIPFFWKSNGKPVQFHKINDTTFTIKGEAPIPNILYTLTDIKVRPFAPAHYLKKYHIKYNPEASKSAHENGFGSWSDLFNSYFNPVWESTMNHTDFPTLNSHILTDVDMNRRLFTANPYFYMVDTAGNQLPYIFKHTELFSHDFDTLNKRIVSGSIDIKSQALNYSDYGYYKENEEKGGYKVVSFPGGSTQTVIYAFNVTCKDPEKRKYFSDIRFRKAMAMAINREEISEFIYKGVIIPQPAGPDVRSGFMGFDYSANIVDFDPEAAERLLDGLGLERNSSGWRTVPESGRIFRIRYVYSPQGGPVGVHRLVKKYWENVGIKTELEESSTEDMRMLYEANDHDLAVWTGVGFWEMSLQQHVEYLLPPYNDTTPMMGIPWQIWFDSGGKKGTEPPDEIKKLKELAIDAQTKIAGSGEYMEVLKKMAEINSENLYLIETVGQSKRVLIVSDRIGNFNKNYYCGGEFSYMMSYNPSQWFIKSYR